MYLNTTLAANGSTASFGPGGRLAIFASGTWGGGTLTLEMQQPGESVWFAVENAAFTATPVSRVAELPPGSLVRLTLTGATSPSITVTLSRFSG